LRAALILVGVVFLATLLVRLPARVLALLLPSQVACAAPSGTVWSGSCDELRAGTLHIAGLSWQLHPAALLRLQLAADVASSDPAAQGQARLRVGLDRDLTITGLQSMLTLPGVLDFMPAGSSGNLQLSVASARMHDAHLVELQGRIALLRLRIANPPVDLGSFELQFPPSEPGAAMVGQLRDLDGPLSVSGVLQLNGAGSYDLEGSVSPKPGASADLTQALQLLGPPDAQGRHTLSMAGTL